MTKSLKLSARRVKALKWVLFCTALIIFSPIFLFFYTLHRHEISPLETLKLIGFPGSNRDYRIDVRTHEKLTSEGGELIFSGTMKFRNGFFAGFDANHAPENPAAVITVNPVLLERLSTLYDLGTWDSNSSTAHLWTESIARTAMWRMWKWDEMITVIQNGFPAKDIYVRLPDRFQELYETSSDFLAVNFQTFEPDTGDRFLKKKIVYRLYADPGKSLRAELTVILKNSSDAPQTYRGAVSIAVPLKGAVMQKNVTRETTEPFRHIFTKEVRVAPDSEITLVYSYALPTEFVFKNDYKLALIKQPSAQLEYEVSAETTDEFDLIGEGWSAAENKITRSGVLHFDETFSFSWIPTLQPLVLQKAEFSKADEITIEFNRSVEGTQAADGLNYILRDTNEIHPLITDQLLIQKIVHSGRYVKLQLAPFTRQPGEVFELQINRIRDRQSGKEFSGTVRLALMENALLKNKLD